MLTISKSTLFNPDGLAARGQCNHDSPGWQLRWFDTGTPPAPVWQGAFKTCRHLQASCAASSSLDEARLMVEELLNTSSFTHFANHPTDAYPSPGAESGSADEHGGGQARKKRKKKKI